MSVIPLWITGMTSQEINIKPFSRCENEAEWRQATQYYQVSSLSPDAVIERLELTCPGLVAVISSLLLHPNTPSLTAAQVDESFSCFMVILFPIIPHVPFYWLLFCEYC